MASGDFSLFDAAAWYLVFLASTTVHEASHAFAALKLGDDTAYQAGQVTLDPTPHIRREPIGMVVVPFLFYFMAGYIVGWASAPYDPDWARRYPKRAGLMALAGPLANLSLVLLAALLIHGGIAAGLFHLATNPHGANVAVALRDELPHLFAVLLSIAFSLNLLLFCFNLLPVPPLDGSSLPLLFLGQDAAMKYSDILRHPALGMIGLIVGYRFFPVLFGPVEAFVTGTLFP
jgi:Zn-dependent protease